MDLNAQNIEFNGTVFNSIEAQQKILSWVEQLLLVLKNKYKKTFIDDHTVAINEIGENAYNYIAETLQALHRIDVSDVSSSGEMFNILKQSEDNLASAVSLMYQLAKGVRPSGDLLYKSGGSFSLAVSTTSAVSTPVLLTVKRIVTLCDILFGLLIAYKLKDTEIYDIIDEISKQVTVLDSTSESFDLLVRTIIAYIKIGIYLASVNEENKKLMYSDIRSTLKSLQQE